MPLHWTIDSRTRLIIATAEGSLAAGDLESCAAAIAGSQALGYRRIFDLSECEIDMTPDEMMATGVRMRAYHMHGTMGPLAVVAPDETIEHLSRLLGMLAAADRPMRLFQALPEARRWIDSLIA